MFSWRCVVCINFLTCFYLRGAGFYRLDALPIVHPSVKTSSPIQQAKRLRPAAHDGGPYALQWATQFLPQNCPFP